jgi:coproporphyrinogen III oxidase-like Fe-S oxidoreductase
MTALRKRRGIDLRDFRESYGFFFEDIYAEQIDRMLDLGMLEVVGGHLQLTRAALIVSNEVFEAFI